MIFLIEYDRDNGRIITKPIFADADRRTAEHARLALELQANGERREIVLLEATDEAALRRTHRRYFVDLGELLVPQS